MFQRSSEGYRQVQYNRPHILLPIPYYPDRNYFTANSVYATSSSPLCTAFSLFI